MTTRTDAVVLKFGGELIEERSYLAAIVSALASVASKKLPLVVVHGGGREIDAALKVAGLAKRQVDGLRITDDATLDVVVSVLAGTVNTRLVAALTSAGVAAVGLTGADAGCGRATVAPPHHTVDGSNVVDLGRVGVPAESADIRVVQTLLRDRFVPVIASIGVEGDGRLLNINADTFAGHLAARLGAERLVIAGATAGVLAGDGETIPLLDAGAIARMVSEGTASAGMVAKLRACEHALAAGVNDVMIVDGRDPSTLERAMAGVAAAKATRVGAETKVQVQR